MATVVGEKIPAANWIQLYCLTRRLGVLDRVVTRIKRSNPPLR